MEKQIKKMGPLKSTESQRTAYNRHYLIGLSSAELKPMCSVGYPLPVESSAELCTVHLHNSRVKLSVTIYRSQSWSPGLLPFIIDYHTVATLSQPNLHCLTLPLLCLTPTLSSCLPHYTHIATLLYFTPQLHVFLYSFLDISPVLLYFDGDAIFSVIYATLPYSIYLNFPIPPCLSYTFLAYLTLFYRLILIGTNIRRYDKCCCRAVGQHRY